jgi:inner membrane protein
MVRHGTQMASLGHIAVAMAATRIRGDNAAPQWASMAWWSVLALLPDIDVIGFALGVPYSAPWGHRGATHSLVFALALAAAIGCAALKLRMQPLRTWSVATIVLVSHGLLDTLTDGGFGCALLWPFNPTRYFAPWRPIPVAPIGLGLLSTYGFLVALTELVLFAPLIVFAVRPKRITWGLLPVWSVAAWLLASGDPLREATLGIVLREQTKYAGGFSEHAFRKITAGQSDADVRHMVGSPLGEWWDYVEADQSAVAQQPGCPWVYLEADRVAVDRRAVARVTATCSERGVHAGMSRSELQRALGRPQNVCWRYTRGARNGFHRVRVVCFADGKVVAVLRRWQTG